MDIYNLDGMGKAYEEVTILYTYLRITIYGKCPNIILQPLSIFNHDVYSYLCVFSIYKSFLEILIIDWVLNNPG